MRLLRRLSVTVSTFVFALLGVFHSTKTGASTKKINLVSAQNEATKLQDERAKKDAKSNVPEGVPVPTPTGIGSGGLMEGPNIPGGSVTGLSTRAGGEGATHRVVQELYDSVPKEKRSLYHSKCAEASCLSKIAAANNVTTVEELKALCEGATSSVYNSSGKYMPPCSSCKFVLKALGIVAEK